ncbi:MAG: RNA methyltransferase [Infirmifilum sp.]|uniref:RNA methyltransferase n=1 Tax=Infirmifilum TaxID=2856573 RepID=UPI00069B3C0D|nr:TrmJ/YjtD family RNA methyltransferase [Infirmifilum uzonense]
MSSACTRSTDISVAFVEPLYEQNIGYLARCMKNFCLYNLVLVKPRCSVGLDAKRYAMHAADIVEKARILESFHEVVREFDMVVCTSGVKGDRVLRRYVSPRDAARIIAESSGRKVIVIGREDWGLSNEELSQCDLLVTIEANPDYPSLNASHAAVIMFYEIFNALNEVRSPSIERPRREEIDKLLEFIDLLGRELGYGEERRQRSKIIMRRVITEGRVSAIDLRVLLSYLGDSYRFIRDRCKASSRDEGQK